VKFKRDNYDTYEECRAAWEPLFESVVSEEHYTKYRQMLDAYKPLDEIAHRLIMGEAKWNADLYGWLNEVIRRLNREANDFYDSVMDHGASQRNVALAKKQGL